MYKLKTLEGTQHYFYTLEDAKAFALTVNPVVIIDCRNDSNRVMYQHIDAFKMVQKALQPIDYHESVTAQGYDSLTFETTDRGTPCTYIFNRGEYIVSVKNGNKQKDFIFHNNQAANAFASEAIADGADDVIITIK